MTALEPPSPARRFSLFAKYALTMVGLVFVVLLINGAVEAWFSYHSARLAILTRTSEKAEAVARAIETSLSELDRQVSWITRASAMTPAQRRDDVIQLLSQQPDMIEVIQLDHDNREQLRVTRSRAYYNSGRDLSRDPRVTTLQAGRISFSMSGTDPQQPRLSITLAHTGSTGVTIAELALPFVQTILNQALTGAAMDGLIADASGRVIASTRQSWIGEDTAGQAKMQAMTGSAQPMQGASTDLDGATVLASSRPIAMAQWTVVTQQPERLALEPLRGVLTRVAVLMALGLIVAGLAGALLARRLLVPIRALRAGADRIGSGDFNAPITIETSDELQDLASRFNAMAGELRETYAGLEAKVEARTRDLAQTVTELAGAHATVQQQAAQLQAQKTELIDWNALLTERVNTQIAEIERIRRLERFLAPQVAQLIASTDDHAALLASHRREVTVVFCDLRGFTAFTESTEPEETMAVLREYHTALGELIFKYEGTLDRFAGDGVMVLFNAPLPQDDHTAKAVQMAVDMRDAIGALCVRWRNRGHQLGFGMGIATGYATLGQIGFEHRLEYAAIGSVTNLASRLCDEAKADQIIVSQRVYSVVEHSVEGRPLSGLQLKGFNAPVMVAEVISWRGRAVI